MIVQDCVLDLKRYWSPYGTVMPPANWPDVSRYENDMVDGAGASAPDWEQLPSGLWVKEFDGNDYATIPTLLDNPPSNVSFSFWFSPIVTFDIGAGTNETLFHKINVTLQDRVKLLLDQANGALRLFTEYNNEALHSTSSAATSWTGGTWYYIVITFDGTWRMYVDTVVEADTQVENGFMKPGTQSDFFFGAGTVPDLYFNGRLSPLSIYTYSLNPDQIKAMFASERHLFDGA